MQQIKDLDKQTKRTKEKKQSEKNINKAKITQTIIEDNYKNEN